MLPLHIKRKALLNDSGLLADMACSVFFNKLRAQQYSSPLDINGADSDIKGCLLPSSEFLVHAGEKINRRHAFFKASFKETVDFAKGVQLFPSLHLQSLQLLSG